VPASLSVEDLAGEHRVVPVSIGGDAWVRQVEKVCAS
jgi:hypothetical protein